MLISRTVQQHTLLITLRTVGGDTVRLVPIVVRIEPVFVRATMVRRALERALAAGSPREAEDRFMDELIDEFNQGDFRIVLDSGVMALPGALHVCYTRMGFLPVRVESSGMEDTLLLLAHQYDVGELPTSGGQHFALCLEDVRGRSLGRNKCYGQYVDKLVLDKVLSNTSIGLYFASCSTAVIACESGKTLGLATLFGVIDASLVCGIPSAMSYIARSHIAYNIHHTGKTSLTLGEKLGLYGGIVGGVTLAKLVQYHALGAALQILAKSISKGRGFLTSLVKNEVIAKLRNVAPAVAELARKSTDALLGATAMMFTSPGQLFQLNSALEKGLVEKWMVEDALREIGGDVINAINEGKKVNLRSVINKKISDLEIKALQKGKIIKVTPGTTGTTGTTGGETGGTATEATVSGEEGAPPETPTGEGIPEEERMAIKELGKGLGCPILGLTIGTIAANLYAGDTIFGGIDMPKLTIKWGNNTLQIGKTIIGGGSK